MMSETVCRFRPIKTGAASIADLPEANLLSLAIDIFHPIAGFLRCAGACVDRNPKFGSDVAGKVQSLVGPEIGMRLVVISGLMLDLRPLLKLADPALPMVKICIIAPGIAHQADSKILRQPCQFGIGATLLLQP